MSVWTLFAADTSARRLALEVGCDLADEKALVEITRLQVVEALLPRRIAARDESLAQVERNILDAADKFVRSELLPRLRTLTEQAEAKAKAALAPLYSDPERLAHAINNSSLVMELGFLSPTITTPHNVVSYAQNFLATWDKVQAIAAKLS